MIWVPTEEILADAKNKIYSNIKTEMIRQGYTTTSLAELLSINRPTVSFAIHGGTTPRDIQVRRKIYKVLRMEWEIIKIPESANQEISKVEVKNIVKKQEH